MSSDFAMVAKLGDVKHTKKADLRQALRCKLNSMKFQSSKPGYYQGENFSTAGAYKHHIVVYMDVEQIRVK